MKVAIVHYWFSDWRGGERVVAELLRLFPDADLYAHVADPALIAKHLSGRTVRETAIARLPFARTRFRFYLPLMPFALEALDLQDYDLIVSSESGPAKGVIKRPDALHICYCHSPMRYLWDMAPAYRRAMGPLTRALFTCVATPLRVWDASTALRVDRFVANSAFVAQRIAAYYGRDSTVIHPPVDIGVACDRHEAGGAPYYVVAGELVDYKRVDLAIAAANRLGFRLVVVGDGERRQRLQARAGASVEFVGRVSDAEFRFWLAGARALLFPGLEDFGIVPVEALARGTPLIAYARGGALEYLVDGVNGVGFARQDVDALCAAIARFESLEPCFLPESVRATAMRFEAAAFNRRFGELAQALRAARDG